MKITTLRVAIISFCMIFSLGSYGTDALSSNHLLRVLNTPTLKARFSGFIDNVLRIVRSDDFYRLTDEIQKTVHPQSDRDLYRALLARSGSIKPWFNMIKKREALTHQKKVLANRVKALIGRYNAHGCLEIGAPGTYLSSMKNFITCNKPFYVLNDKQRISDALSTLSIRPLVGPKPYDRFIALNDYAPISPQAIPDFTVDMIVCMPGLHHASTRILPAFVASLYRIVRPGGFVIIRDHDAFDDDTMSLVHAAHIVFNAIFSQDSLEDEMEEYRNFQPLSYWVTLFENAGFKKKEAVVAQEGDPTLNTLILFQKDPAIAPEECSDLSRLARQNPDYVRPLAQSYQTGPEWANVFISQEYAEFQKKNKFYDFPHLKSLGAYWNVFNESFRLACRTQGIKDTIFSQYTAMDLFIGFSMTLEYIYRSLVTAPFRLTKATIEPYVEKLFLDLSTDYAQFICHTPFYEYSFLSGIKKFWLAFFGNGKKDILNVVKNLYIGLAFSVGTAIKAALSAPLALAFSGAEVTTIGMIVYDPEESVARLPGVVVKKKEGNCAFIEVPRYEKFTQLVKDMVLGNMHIYEIAGQKYIQLTIKADATVDLASLPGATIEYQWSIPSQPAVVYYAVTADIGQLKNIFMSVQKKDAIVLYIHDF